MNGISDTDLKLVAELLKSPRATYADLARITGVSETTARRRVETLIEQKVITPAMIPDVRRLGFETMTLVGVKVNLKHIHQTAEAIAALPQVTSIHMTMGRYDLILTLADRSMADIADLLYSTIAAFPGVRDLETFISVKALKILQDWRMPIEALGANQDEDDVVTEEPLLDHELE